MSAAAGDSSDGESGGEGEFLSPGSSMSSMAFDADQGQPHHDSAAESRAAAARRGGNGNGESSSSSSLQSRGPGGGTGIAMDTIEEETPSAVQDSPQRSSLTRSQRQQPMSPLRGSCQGLVQQQLSEQQLHSCEWNNGVHSLSQGLGHAVGQALAAPFAEDEVESSSHDSQVRVQSALILPLVDKGNGYALQLRFQLSIEVWRRKMVDFPLAADVLFVVWDACQQSTADIAHYRRVH